MIRRITTRIVSLVIRPRNRGAPRLLDGAVTRPAAIPRNTEPSSNEDVSILNEHTISDAFAHDGTRNQDFDVENSSVILSL